jgi:hypothetical protein
MESDQENCNYKKRGDNFTIGERHSDSFVSLKDYITMQTDARDRAIDAAYKSMEKRLDGMNEFRQTLSDQGKTFLPRLEFDAQHQRVIDAIDAQNMRFLAALDALNVRFSKDIDELKKDRISMAGMQSKLWIILIIGAFLAVLLTNHLLVAVK